MPEQISFKVIKEGGQNRFLKVKHGEEEKEIDLKGKEMDALKGEIVGIFRLEKDKVLFKDVNGEFCYDIPCQEVAFEGLDVVFLFLFLSFGSDSKTIGLNVGRS